jgi:putative ABC transport system substrate-binding protein
MEGFLAGLRDFGYVEGKNLLIESGWAEGNPERLPSLASELIALNVDVIVSTGGSVTALAAKRATSSIPIVFTVGGDLVKLGLVSSLARPGGNLTGLSLLTTELNVKRLELLQETFPQAHLIGVLGNPTNPNYIIQVEETKDAAKALGLRIERFEVPNASDLYSVLSSVSKKSVRALLVLSDPCSIPTGSGLQMLL